MTSKEDKELFRLYDEYKRAQAAYEAAKEAAIKRLSDNPNTKITMDLGDRIRSATLVHANMTTILPTIREDIGTRLWNKVVKPQVDKAMVEHMVAAGRIDPSIVAKHTHVTPKKPYLNFSEGQA